jgi:hypothetical protein
MVLIMSFWRTWSASRIISGLTFLSLFWGFPIAIAQAGTAWKVAGQTALNFEYGEIISREKISQLNRRLNQIVTRLNPNQAWLVDLAPLPPSKPKPLKKGAKPELPSPPKSLTIRLQGMNLLEVNESDVKVHQADSVKDLADTWVRSLSAFFGQPGIRQSIAGTLSLPSQVSYENIPYLLKPEVAIDRGLFRASGKLTEGKAVFIELPADQKAFQMNESFGSTPLPLKEIPKTIFLLNNRLQFVPYVR